MKYIGKNAIKKLISLIKGDLATKQPTITASGLLKGDGAGTVTAADTQEATLVDVPNGLLKGDGTTISAAVPGTDYAAASHNHDSSYLKLSGGKLTGNLTGKYITGTWLQTTEATALGSAATKICVLDSSGWVYYRTPAEILNDIEAAKSNHDHYGRVIQPTSIELFPGTSAGHGGYIDFHYNSDSADYTSRIYEPSKGMLVYNGHRLLTTAHIITFWNQNVTFTNGVAEFVNSNILANMPCFVQYRASRVASTFQDTVLSVNNPTAGKLTIVAKNGASFTTCLNILIFAYKEN